MGQTWDRIPFLYQIVLSVYASNAIGDVYLLGPRINHSCIPNVHFAFNTAIEKETFHAMRDIQTGEELTIMYNPGTKPYS